MWMSRSGGVWEVGSPIGGRGRLRVYLGTAAGVGKTYAMLTEARSLAGSGVDVVVGPVETHDRGDTEQMLDALEQVPRRQVGYRGSTFGEPDVGAVLKRRPAAVVVGELAHTCVPEGRQELSCSSLHLPSRSHVPIPMRTPCPCMPREAGSRDSDSQRRRRRTRKRSRRVGFRGVAMTLSNTSVGSWMNCVHGRGPQQDIASRGLR